MDMTWSEIHDLFTNKHLVFVDQSFDDVDDSIRRIFVTDVSYTNGQYEVHGMSLPSVASAPVGIKWYCNNEDEYPHIISD